MEMSTAIDKSQGREIRWLVVALVVCLFALLANMVVFYQDSRRDQDRLDRLAEMRVQIRTIASAAEQALAGDLAAFELLQREHKTHAQNSRHVVELSKGDKGFSDGGLGQLNSSFNGHIAALLGLQDNLMLLNTDIEVSTQALPTLRQQWADILELLLSRDAIDAQVMAVNEQIWLTDRMIRQLDYVRFGQGDGMALLQQFAIDAGKINATTADLMRGATNLPRLRDDTARGLLSAIDEQLAMLARSIRQVGELAVVYADAKAAADAIDQEYLAIDQAAERITGAVENLADSRYIGLRSMVVFALISTLLLFLVLLRQRRLTQAQLAESAAVTERNQKAILRLLDELADLADGDLTVSATVTEDFTGAIADSINFTVDQLRVLVSNINDTAVKVSGAAQDSQATALQLAKASEHQAHEIAGASAAINEMAVTIDQVSLNAEESARVADRSVQLADTGANVVRNTIEGMDTIREQIQDTSKRIKRLGESSQEIGDIISLINDIADQTNILALNAAIQASMAGDAGRGFAVVADEVQRLAERSSAATRQIEALVKTIQSDTSEAVISMEKTTADVVRGAELANDAGVALAEIEEVSGDLAELIQNISNAARQQASSANHVSNTMNVIQDITSQTAQGTMATARSIGNLSDLANELRNSVAGFTLPHKAAPKPKNVADRPVEE
ncbi:MAG TPA: methyl-accepting chemotaxis protein [Pseudomonadales bacterium]|nr:methyl-accepting chemotaxis protein [Pseudomonadales bacterium]